MIGIVIYGIICYCIALNIIKIYPMLSIAINTIVYDFIIRSHLTYYPQQLARNGITAMMPILPFHDDRVSAFGDHGESFLTGPDEVMERKFVQAVTDVRTCIDYLEQSGYRRVDIMGISSGGMIGTIAMALDPRIDRGVLIITGGNLELIAWKSVAMKQYRTARGKERRRLKERSVRLLEEFEDHAESFASNRNLQSIPPYFRYDPSLFANLINRERVFMFNALIDPFIPRSAADDLWRRLGKPARRILPSGHLTAHVLFKGYIMRKSLEFLSRDSP